MKYLVYFGSGIGDVAIIYPFLYAICAHDKDAVITLLQCNYLQRTNLLRSLLPVLPAIGGIEYYSIKEPLHDLSLLNRLGRKKYDFGFALQYTVKRHTSKWPMRILRYSCKKTIGFANPYRSGVVYDEAVTFDGKIRRIDNFYKMLDCIGIPHEDQYGDMIGSSALCAQYLPADFQVHVSDPKIVALVIGCTDFRRSWFYDRWMMLAHELLSNGCQVIILGGAKEAREMRQQGVSVPKYVDSYIGTCTLLASLALLSRASIIIGADTGLTQFAGILGKKNITLLGCTDARQVLPYGENSHYITAGISCSPCFSTEREATCKEAVCMKAITVNRVLRKMKEVM